MRRFRTVASAIAIVVGALCIAVWVLSSVLINSITDTDAFASVATRIVDSPEVTQAITVQAQTTVQDEFRQQGIDLEAFGVEGLVNTAIESAVESDDFTALLAPQIEQGHRQFVLQLTEDTREPAPLVLSFDVTDLVNQRLDAEPLLGALVPSVDIAPVNVEVVDAETFEQARTGFALLEWAHTWALWMGLALLLGGLLVSPRRRWFLAKFALAVGVCCLAGWAIVAWRGPGVIAGRFEGQDEALGGALSEVISTQTVEAAADRLLVWALVSLAAAGVFSVIAFVTRTGSQGGIRHLKEQ